MSLASTASLWTNDDISTRKRQPSMARKTIKKPMRPTDSYQEYNTTQDPQEYVLNNIDDVQNINEERSKLVNDIINQMSSVSAENDGAKLADFNPPPKPSIQIKKDLQTGWIKPDEKIPDLENPLQMPAPSFSNTSVNPYIVNNANVTNLGNYQQVYNPDNVEYKPYYAKLGLGSGSTDNKLMEKINYMIHLLENQEAEQTSNITEEFLLYTFLGVFVIFVIDSFSKTRKYIR